MKLLLAFSLFVFLTWASPLQGDSSIRIRRNIGGRIIDGSQAYVGQFPFAAAINVQTSNSRFFCGGTLLSNAWILTAGSCVNDVVLFTIQLGSNSLQASDTNRVTVTTSDYVLHPDFNPTTLENDIGLIKLSQPIVFTDYIKPIDGLSTVPIQVVTSFIAIGWGQVTDSDTALSDKINFVLLSALSNTECQGTYGNQITNNMVCMGGNYNQGSCIGDTGGALIAVAGRAQMIHVAIASFVSGNGCESLDPSGYTRTFPYNSWIRSTANITI